MSKSITNKSLLDAYRFKGFTSKAKIKSHLGISKALILPLVRRQKKLFVDVVEKSISLGMIVVLSSPVTFLQAIIKFTLNLKSVGYFVESVRQ